MLKFHYSYKDPTYHKEDDPPWEFPPRNLKTEYHSNIIEIQGKNGSGKSTLLNVIALAFGYLKYENELDEKRILKDKLRQLDDFNNLEYVISASSSGPKPLKIEINKPTKNVKKIILNDKNVSKEELDKFDVIFLTEDDPRKVVTVSIGKINNFLKTLEKRVNDVSGRILQQNSLVTSYNNAKKDEKNTLDKIDKIKKAISEYESELVELKESKEKVDLRDELKEKYDIIKDEEKIKEHYRQLRREVKKLEGKDLDKLYDEIIKEENSIQRNRKRITQSLEPSIRELCIIVNTAGFEVDVNKLLDGDRSEQRKIDVIQRQEKKSNDEYQLKLVQDLIRALGKHPSDLTVPTLNKNVSTLLKDLTSVRSRLTAGSVQEKIDSLKREMKKRETALRSIDRSQRKIAEIEKDMEGFDDFKIIKKEFDKIEERYLDLQKLSNEDKIRVLEQYKKLEAVAGDSEDLDSEIKQVEVQKTVQEQTLNQLKTRLSIIRENMSKEPKYANKEKQLREKYDQLFKISKTLRRWINIIEAPYIAKQEYEKNPDEEFGIAHYNNFVESLGQYLGQMFEPVTFSDQIHEIVFYDIEKERFRTKEDRYISIQDLSVGQNKITALETSLKNIDANKKGIVLIDEIADLDNENMGKVRRQLKRYYEKGRIQFAILVRPMLESNSENVKIMEL
ncbi:MAG: hypothetical protein ACTSW1_09110 [Candidatus Hodarchaeales archaeon]